MSLSNDEIYRRFSTIRTWSRGDQRAPHKPLLLLMRLAALQRGEPRLTDFNSVEQKLTELLK